MNMYPNKFSVEDVDGYVLGWASTEDEAIAMLERERTDWEARFPRAALLIVSHEGY